MTTYSKLLHFYFPPCRFSALNRIQAQLLNKSHHCNKQLQILSLRYIHRPSISIMSFRTSRSMLVDSVVAEEASAGVIPPSSTTALVSRSESAHIPLQLAPNIFINLFRSTPKTTVNLVGHSVYTTSLQRWCETRTGRWAPFLFLSLTQAPSQGSM